MATSAGDGGSAAPALAVLTGLVIVGAGVLLAVTPRRAFARARRQH
jgi:hypothetical protein